MAERKCDNCAQRGPWRAEYSRVPSGTQGHVVATCPHAWPGTGVSPGSGTHCEHFIPRAPSPADGWAEAGLVCQACAGDAPRGKCCNPKCVGGPIVRELVPAAGVSESQPSRKP